MSQDNTFAEAKVRLSIDASGLEAGLAKVQQLMKSYANEFEQIYKSAGFVADKMLNPIKDSVNLFTGFDDAIRAAQGIFNIKDNSPQEMKEAFAGLTEQAKELGRTTSWTATEVASGMVALARSTNSIEKTSNMISGVMDAARATGTAIDVTADLAVQTMSQFGITSEDTAHVMDVMVTAANSSAQTFEDLGWALSQCGTLSSQVGYSLEETSAAIGMLANVGIKGTAAGTAMKSVLSNLINPSQEVKKELERIGLNVKDPSGTLRPLRDILADMVNLTQDLDQTDRNAFFANVFGMRGMPAALGLANVKPEDFDAITSAIANADNAAAETAAIMDSGIGGSLRLMKSALDGIKISIAEGVVPELQKLIEKFTPLLTKVAEFIKEHPKLVVAIGGIGTAFAGLKLATFGLGQILQTISHGLDAIVGTANLLSKINVSGAAEGLAKALGSLSEAAMVAGVVAVAIGVLALAKNLFSAQAQARRVNEELERLTSANNQVRKEDFQKYNVLMNLEKSGELNDDQLGIAKTALEELRGKYVDIGGVRIEGNRVVGASAGFDAFKTQIIKSAVRDIDKQIETAEQQKKEALKDTVTVNEGGPVARFMDKVPVIGNQAEKRYLEARNTEEELRQKRKDILTGFYGMAMGESKEQVYETLASGAGGMDATAINNAIQAGVSQVGQNLNVTVPTVPVSEAGADAAATAKATEETARQTKRNNDYLRIVSEHMINLTPNAYAQ